MKTPIYFLPIFIFLYLSCLERQRRHWVAESGFLVLHRIQTLYPNTLLSTTSVAIGSCNLSFELKSHTYVYLMI